jgi:hypothetical protein
MSSLLGLVASHPWVTVGIVLHLTSTAYVLILMAQSDREFAREQSQDSSPADLTGPVSSAFLERFARSAAQSGSSTSQDFEIAKAA